MVRIDGATPIFDLMAGPVDCVNKIEITPAALPLAPAATQLEFRGPFLQSGWSVGLKEEIGTEFSSVPTIDSVERNFRVCIGSASGEKALLLGALPRAEATSQAQLNKREKQQ